MSEESRTIIETKRRELGYTVSKLSELTGIAQTTLLRILNGKTKIVKQEHLESIAKAFCCRPQDLRSGTKYVSLSDATTHISADEAGKPLVKQLTASESLLLYFFQNCSNEKKELVLTQASRMCTTTQRTVSKMVSQIIKKMEEEPMQAIQLTLDDRE